MEQNKELVVRFKFDEVIERVLQTPNVPHVKAGFHQNRRPNPFSSTECEKNWLCQMPFVFIVDHRQCNPISKTHFFFQHEIRCNLITFWFPSELGKLPDKQHVISSRSKCGSTCVFRLLPSDHESSRGPHPCGTIFMRPSPQQAGRPSTQQVLICWCRVANHLKKRVAPKGLSHLHGQKHRELCVKGTLTRT